MLQRIQICNLEAGVSEAQIRALFLPHGRVVSYERPTAPESGRPGGYVYIEMDTEAADAAVQALNGSPAHGQPLEVILVDPSAGRSSEADRHARSPQRRRMVLPPSDSSSDRPA
jgi:RNA recognition motif-containing protein